MQIARFLYSKDTQLSSQLHLFFLHISLLALVPFFISAQFYSNKWHFFADIFQQPMMLLFVDVAKPLSNKRVVSTVAHWCIECSWRTLMCICVRAYAIFSNIFIYNSLSIGAIWRMNGAKQQRTKYRVVDGRRMRIVPVEEEKVEKKNAFLHILTQISNGIIEHKLQFSAS